MPGPLPFRRILCPVDFSANSRDALRYGAELARRAHGELTILFANDPLLAPAAAAAGYNVRKLAEETTAELNRFVKRTLGADAASPAVRTTLGHAAPAIAKTAEAIKADLIVMGSRGLTAPAKWFSGSTTERVLRTTKVPVLVVPTGRTGSPGRWLKALAAWPGSRIVIPVDITDASAAEVRTALATVSALKATPVLLHVLSESALPPWLTVERKQIDRARLAGAHKALQQLAARAPATLEVVVGRPFEQIIATADRLKAGLIVMTLKRSSSLYGPRRGVVTYQVLSRDRVPVLALPGR